MLFARVVGNVVCTRKDERLKGMKLLIVEELTIERKPTGNFIISADAVSAGASETVLLVAGSSARLTERTLNCPVDSAICAIVDEVVQDKDRIK